MHLTPRIFLALGAAATTAGAIPEGFEIHDFAAPFDVDYPTGISAAADGTVYVASDRNGSLDHKPDFGRIFTAKDTDGDGKADEFKQFVPKVNSPRGLHFVGGDLYLIHPPYLTRYTDTNGDGVADQEKQLVKGFGFGIEHPRGADHTTNGVHMGIDGWLYVAVGDFGMPDAVGADGKHMTLHGGGVVRVRPDGSEVEPYALYVRNICEVIISPTLDMFSRDNTNDGKGWNTRFHHYFSMADHGYPRLYQNFADEAVSPLADYGGGSGTGGLWLSEPGFPKEWKDTLFSCDWTTGNVYHHPYERSEATFKIKQEVFQQTPRAIDIDVDGNSKIYIADWRGGAYTYAGDGKKVGMIRQVTFKGEKPAVFPDLKKLNDAELVKLISSESAVCRLEVQREIIKRGRKVVFAKGLETVAKDTKLSAGQRVAAIFTFKQLYGKDSNKTLVEWNKDATIREFTLRALADRKSELAGVPKDIFVEGLKDSDPRVRLQAAIGLARLGAKEAAPAILAEGAKWNGPAGERRILPHVAMQALAELANEEACLKGFANAETRPLALLAIERMHTQKAVDGLIALAQNGDDDVRFSALSALARLFHKDKEWDLKSWWNTRPDDRGPYFEPVAWDQTPKIKATIEEQFAKIPSARQAAMINLLTKNRISVSQLSLKGIDPVVLALSADKPEAGQVAVLIDATKDAKRTWEQRLAAYRMLSKLDAKAALPARLEVLAAWSTQPNDAQSKEIADFVNEPQRAKEVGALIERGAKGSDEISRIAWKSLLTITRSPLADAKAKEEVKKALDANPREVGLFLAITDLKLGGFDQQIQVAMNSDNTKLIEAAKAAQAAGKATGGSGKKVAELSVEEVTKHAMNSKGDVAAGERLFTSQGCVACHSTDPKAVQKGPYLGAAGAKFTRDYLIESVLKPDAVVAQGFQTVMFTMKDKSVQMGFVTGEADGVIELRNIAGQVSNIKRADVAEEKAMPQSMMPPGLAAGLTVEDFTSLVEYLVSLKAQGG